MTNKKPVTRNGENLVKLIGPDGKTYEVGHRNASDLLQNHKGWKIADAPSFEQNALAQAPRDKRTRGKAVEATAEAPKKGRGRPAKKAVEVPVDDEEEEAKRKALDAEFAALEAEEEARAGNDQDDLD